MGWNVGCAKVLCLLFPAVLAVFFFWDFGLEGLIVFVHQMNEISMVGLFWFDVKLSIFE